MIAIAVLAGLYVYTEATRIIRPAAAAAQHPVEATVVQRLTLDDLLP